MPYGPGFTYLIGAQILFFIITLSLIIWFIKSSRPKELDPPREILNKRLASGDISSKEYDSLLKKIQKEV